MLRVIFGTRQPARVALGFFGATHRLRLAATMGANASFLAQVDLTKPLDDATLQKIVDVYDKDHSGALDEKEVNLFIKEWGKAHSRADLNTEALSKSFLEQYEAFKVRTPFAKVSHFCRHVRLQARYTSKRWRNKDRVVSVFV